MVAAPRQVRFTARDLACNGPDRIPAAATTFTPHNAGIDRHQLLMGGCLAVCNVIDPASGNRHFAMGMVMRFSIE